MNEERKLLTLKFELQQKQEDLLRKAIAEKENESKLIKKKEAQIATEFKNSQNSNNMLKEATKKLYQQVRGLKDEVESRTEDFSESAKKQNAMKGELDAVMEEKRELTKQIAAVNSKFSKLEESHKKLTSRLTGNGKGGEVNEGKEVKTLKFMLRMKKEKLNCAVCKEREKQVMLSKCLHMFCRICIKQQMTARNRSCPLCKKKFDPNVDVKQVTF